MSIYVGVDFDYYTVTTLYVSPNNDEKRNSYLVLDAEHELENALKEIKSNLDENDILKCICFRFSFLITYGQTRERICNLGKKHGFEKAIMCDRKTVNCLSIIMETQYIIRIQDNILIIDKCHMYLWTNNECQKEFAFQDDNEFETALTNIKDDSVSLDIIIYMGNDVEKKEILVKKYFQNYKFYYDAELKYVESESKVCETLSIPKKIIKNNENAVAVGIDLGMSKCCVAVNRKNGIEAVAIDNNERTLPSYVSYDEKLVKCGQIVVERLRFFSESTVFDTKRIIGRHFKDVKIDSMWPFSLINDYNKAVIEVNTYNDVNACKTAEQVTADLLKYIRKKTEEYQGRKLRRAVITIPASFTDAQKAATKSAASSAGWDSVYLLSEPVAASFAYFIDQEIPNNTVVLLFDLGGGTLDVCISKIENSKICTVSNSGNSQLGGRDFDNILIEYFTKKLNDDYGIEITGGKKYKLILDVEEFDPAKEGFIRISRETFENLSQTLLTQIRTTIEDALKLSEFEVIHINKVLQVGGSCRMPVIKHLLSEVFPNVEHCCDKHPEEVVAIGAAYYAYNFFFA